MSRFNGLHAQIHTNTKYANCSHFSRRAYDEHTFREKHVSAIEKFPHIHRYVLNKYSGRKDGSESNFVYLLLCFQKE